MNSLSRRLSNTLIKEDFAKLDNKCILTRRQRNVLQTAILKGLSHEAGMSNKRYGWIERKQEINLQYLKNSVAS